AADRYMTLPKGRADRLSVAMTATEPLTAPVTKGQRVGTLKVSFESKPIAEFPLVALQDVPLGSFFGRVWDTMRLWFK
ncbi:MAG TPA: D-alanyl-D-alanine carboxypeptidase, partial [Casimicrobiaceae bacterium]|nr:D-alanyl-D-alanine carboxypeptidase [Casimicrobiaceae bacterium]